MKKASVYFTEKNCRLDSVRRSSVTIEVPDAMFDGWDWSGIEQIFRAESKPYVQSDSTVRVNRIKLGRAVLQG